MLLNVDDCTEIEKNTYSCIWKAMPDVKQWTIQNTEQKVGITGKSIVMGDFIEIRLFVRNTTYSNLGAPQSLFHYIL